MKIMYPAKLGPGTKCPHCKTPIIPIGTGTLFNCQNGHIVECVVMVTVNRLPEFTEKAASEQLPPSNPSRIHGGVQSDSPVLPPKVDKLQ